MTNSRALRALVSVALAATVAGCANDATLFGDAGLTTSSITPPAVKMPAPKVDPACVALSAKIDGLRQEGVAGRLAKVSTGKTKTVSIKRDSLAKMTELDGANQEFQAKCTTLLPAKAHAAAAPVALTTTALPKNVQIVGGPQAAATATLAKAELAKAIPAN